MTNKEKMEFVKNHPAEAYAYCYSGLVSFHGIVYGIEDYAVLSIGKRIAAPQNHIQQKRWQFSGVRPLFQDFRFCEDVRCSAW